MSYEDIRPTPSERSNSARVAQRGVSILLRPNSERVFFVYAGMAGQLMMDPLKFFRTADLMGQNLVLLRDVRSEYYLRGISEEVNSLERLVSWQRSLVERLPDVKRVLCIGTSMGGYAALACGHLLQADEVWALAPQTRLPQEIRQRALVQAELCDLSGLLAKSNGRTRYNVYFNVSCVKDREEALRIANCAGVHLWPQAGDGHAVVRALLASGQLSSLFVSRQ